MKTKNDAVAPTIGGTNDDDRVKKLREGWDTDEGHPALTLTDDELEAVFRGVDPTASNGDTGTNATEFPKFCCDGTRVCCNM